MKNLFSAIALLALTELVIVAWFLYGQGYDRTAAIIVIERALLLVPLVSAGLMYNQAFQSATKSLLGMPKSWLAGYIRTLVAYSAMLCLGVGLPAVVVIGMIKPPGPFYELWLTLGGIVVLLGGMLYIVFQPQTSRHWFALGYFCLVAAIQLAIKWLIVSIF